MSDTTETPRKTRPLLGDLIIPLGTIAFATYYIYSVWELPWQANSAGLGIGGAMAIILVILFARFATELKNGDAEWRWGDVASPLNILGLRVAILVASLAFIFVMPYLGFTLSLFIFLIVGVMILSGTSQIKKGVIIAFLVSISGYLLFIVFIRARFPRGPVENFLGGLF